MTKPYSKSGFWPVILETLSGRKLQKEEAEHADKRVREVTGWSDPVEESTGFVEAACKNYEALIDERRAGKTGTGAGPSGRHDTQSITKRHDGAVVKIFGNGVKIVWNGQKREGAMCTCGRGNGHMCTLEYCKYD